ncbi:MAG: threonylcarbamoyl-AMP synthase [Oscillospiraceae bacterium]|nr:threonylcarbamoyl-AMP synthase [Oscillospiraceae bacterium]
MDLLNTKLLPASEAAYKEAAELLRSGELVGIPTETVYGLAANALDRQAVLKIFEAKGRPADNPLIVHIWHIDQLDELCDPPALAYTLAKAFWPGPLTMTLPRKPVVQDCVTASLPTVGIRMPSHSAAAAIIRESGCPLAAPSGNRSGSPSPTTAAHMYDDMDGRIPLIVDGGECDVGLESTVIMVKENSVRILRPGGITVEQLQEFCDVEVDDGVFKKLEPGQKAASPGMLYKHYAPKAEVTIVAGTAEQYRAFLKEKKADGVFAMAFDEELSTLPCPGVSFGRQDDPATQAHRLFSALRECDELGAKVVYAHSPGQSGIGLAIYNRLLRAAGFRVITL